MKEQDDEGFGRTLEAGGKEGELDRHGVEQKEVVAGQRQAVRPPKGGRDETGEEEGPEQARPGRFDATR